jgi:outer membrane lipoprotein-sorting protein
MKNVVLFLIVFISITCSNFAFAQDPMEITSKMFSNVKSMKTLQYSFDSKERVGNKIVHEISDVKLNIQPLKVYLYQHKPTEGVEVLFLAGENSNNAKVNPNAFPWVTLNLNPEGSLMLDNHHHSIYDGGFAYTTSLIEFLLNKYKDQCDKLIKNNGIVKIQGVDCYYLTFSNTNYRLTNYIVGDNETPLTIAKKLKLNYFSILETNPNIKGLNTIKPGTRLILSNDYASKMELYIHKDKLYPVYIKIYDNKGLYEEYTFINVVINPVFKNDAFSADNSKYNF